MRRKPNGYWQKWENLEKELNKAIGVIGHFPTAMELNEHGCSSLGVAIRVYHGGTNTVKEKMGYKIKSKPPSYWKDWENTKKELEKVIRKLGHFPTQRELSYELDCYYLNNAISRYHNGFISVREKIGYESRYWTEKRMKKTATNVAIDYLKIHKKATTITFHKFLRKYNVKENKICENGWGTYSGFYCKIDKKITKGRDCITYILDLLEDKKLKEKIREAVDETSHKWTLRRLEKTGRQAVEDFLKFRKVNFNSSFKNFLGKYDVVKRKLYKDEDKNRGTYYAFGTKLYKLAKLEEKNEIDIILTFLEEGELKEKTKSILNKYNKPKKVIKSKGYWNWENTKRKLNDVIDKVGHFPTQKELYANGYGDLVNGISKYHGGINTVKEKMGHKIKSKPPNYWKEWENTKKELEKVIREIGHFPSCKYLEKVGYSSLVFAMYKYHGGINTVREKLGHPRPNSIKTAQALYEYIKNDGEAKEAIKAAVGVFGVGSPNMGYIREIICQQMVPGYKSYSVTMLSPYIGDTVIDELNLSIQERIAGLPEGIIEEENVYDELFKMLDVEYRCRFYDNPESMLNDVMNDMNDMNNKAVKKLLKEVYVKYKDIHEFDADFNAKSMIINPEYKNNGGVNG